MGRRAQPLMERFWSQLEPAIDGCWNWSGQVNTKGYGRFKTHPGISAMAHRFSYERLVGPIPPGLHIDHLCRNRTCVNPAHLEAVTARENNARSECASTLNARKTACVNGHEFTPENTRQNPAAPKRVCVICARGSLQRHRLRFGRRERFPNSLSQDV